MADMSITFGQLSLDLPEPTPIPEPTKTFMNEWCEAAMEVVGNTPMHSESALLVNNEDNSKFIDMCRCHGMDDYAIFSKVMDADSKYLTMHDCAIAVVTEPTKANYQWIVIYRGVQLPAAIISTKIENSLVAFTYMHMERMRRIAKYYNAEIIFYEDSIRVTHNGQILAVLALSSKRTDELIKFDFIEHSHITNGSRTIYSATLPAVESVLCANKTMEKIWAKLKDLFPKEEVCYNIYGNSSSIYVGSTCMITYLGSYNSAIAAVYEGTSQLSGYDMHLYMDKTYNDQTSLARYYLVNIRFPIFLPNMTNCGDKLMEVMKAFNIAMYKKHVNKPTTRKIKDNGYVIGNIPENSGCKYYGSMWIENAHKPPCIARVGETIQVYPYMNNTRIVTCICDELSF